MKKLITLLILLTISTSASALDFRVEDTKHQANEQSELDEYKRNPLECAFVRAKIGVTNSGREYSLKRNSRSDGWEMPKAWEMPKTGYSTPRSNKEYTGRSCTPASGGLIDVECDGGDYTDGYMVGIYSPSRSYNIVNEPAYIVISNQYVKQRFFLDLNEAENYWNELHRQSLCKTE